MARLTTKQRKRLPKASFALPGKRTTSNPSGQGAYPIPDEAHARNALARVAQHGTAAEQAAVRRKVAQKFPSIAVGGKKRAKR